MNPDRRPIPPPPKYTPPPPPVRYMGKYVRGEPPPRWIVRYRLGGRELVVDLFGPGGRDNARRHAKKIAVRHGVMAVVETITPQTGEPT